MATSDASSTPAGSFSDFGGDMKNAGQDVASTAKDTASDSAQKEGADLANDLIADAKQGKAPEPSAVKDRALESGKKIAHDTGAAGLDAAKQKADQQVDKALNIIGNEFPLLGGILGALAKPIIDHALKQVEMPDF